MVIVERVDDDTRTKRPCWIHRATGVVDTYTQTSARLEKVEAFMYTCELCDEQR